MEYWILSFSDLYCSYFHLMAVREVGLELVFLGDAIHECKTTWAIAWSDWYAGKVVLCRHFCALDYHGGFSIKSWTGFWRYVNQTSPSKQFHSRSTVPSILTCAFFAVVLEIVIVPRWGLYGFVAASMLSILGTHKILFFHRRLQYHNEDGSVKDIITETDQLYSSPEKDTLAKETKVSIPVILALLISSCALLIAAFAIDIYEVTAERPEGTTSEAYSILRVGLDLPPSALEPNSIGTRWIQLMFFLFLLAFPMCNVLLFGTLYLYPMTKALRERVFLLAEISFSWTCVEVFMGSAIFSVLQIPKFGNGLIDAGCPQCFKVGSKILPAFSILVIASVVQISVNVWLFRKAHRAVYPMVQS